MADDDRTRARRPDGFISRGNPVGYTEREDDYAGGDRYTARRPDGFISKGEEKGYVDPKDRVRRRDGFIFRGEHVANIKGRAVHDVDGFITRGLEWGYVDDEGNVRQRDGFIFRGRVIGHVRGPHPEKTLAHFVFAFDRLTDRLAQLQARERDRPDDPTLPDRADRLLKFSRSYDALGDFEGLERSLRDLKERVEVRLENNLVERIRPLLKEADRLSYSTDWKVAGDRLRQIRAEWNQHPVSFKHADTVWASLMGCLDRFHQRRQEHFEKADAERAANLRLKQGLVARAEALASSSDWKETGEAMKALMARWKEVGPVPREHTEPLWNRFSTARQRFYDRRTAHFAARDRELAQNLDAKEALCREAERLGSASDLRAAADAVKDLQTRWKGIGHVPRDAADALWGRFRSACDYVFIARKQQAEARQAAWRSNMEEALQRKVDQLSRLRESIDHDEGLIAGWESTIDNLRPGGRADEIRDSLNDKIRSVEDRIHSKRSRAEDLTESIADIRAKL